ncbi:UDP-2,3-diacylglucosamine diphosphatase [Candidatus Ichthyocystis hellenicum]|uniref:UDP-2,3-diacylglucosamine diphosphatase n=1 Tax=Candidatus Ichthyocystis hellenicum TaxID=1561003 RepID=UPI000B836D0B|nr:UDP-2,3-diacylglucosamine diphosphatase [Candidatus Ichthyocystis hellenicum]
MQPEQSINKYLQNKSYSIFLSDINLCESRPEIWKLFMRFMNSDLPKNAEKIFILGNLFNMWIGDDDLRNSWPAKVAHMLAMISSRNISVNIMVGNHDFLLGKEFCNAVGATLLSDPQCIDLYGVKTLITHGDSLCTDDIEYQIFRNRIRQSSWKREFLSQPSMIRRAINKQLRAHHDNATRRKPEEYLDVNQNTIFEILSETKAQRIIHGYTNKPGIHNHILEGRVVRRWVLQNWDKVGSSSNAGVLIVSEKDCYGFNFSDKNTEINEAAV